MRSLWLALLLFGIALSGCLGDGGADDGSDDDPGSASDTDRPTNLANPNATTDSAKSESTYDDPTFSSQLLIDDVRAGGEPVIAVLQSGTILVSAHPGWTHYHPSSDPTHPGTELLTPANAQSYLWRSTDDGATWTHVDVLAQVPNLPRSTALGVSDPEFTVMEDGTVCMTDLIALASSSTSCSTDDGVSWLPGNSVASEGVNDRQWLASSGDEFYFTANYFASTYVENPAGHVIRASTDYGLTWQNRGNVPCHQDLVGNPHTGNIIVDCGAGVGVSEDGGWNWDVRRLDNESLGIPRGSHMSEPAIDAAGNTWVSWPVGERRLFVAGTPDEGLTWPWVYEVTPHFRAFSTDNPHGVEVEDAGDGMPGTNGTYIWPWISAGSDGRFAITWIGQYNTVPSPQSQGPYYVFTAYFIDASTNHPQVFVESMTPDPIHVHQICQSGTACQATSMAGLLPEEITGQTPIDPSSGDRRLGDFFETTVDEEGYLLGTWSNTAARPDDVISHPEFVRQIGGVRLLVDEDIGVYMPTQG